LNDRVVELEKLHEALVKAQVEADLENERKSEFLSTVNHELRTPLTSIHGALELVKIMTPPDSKRKADQLIDVAYRNSSRLKFLVNDILDTEKIDSGSIKFYFEKHLISDLLREAVDLNQPYAQKY
jgi:signal transduction histidine kinase